MRDTHLQLKLKPVNLATRKGASAKLADRKFDGMCHLLVGPAIERDALRTHRFLTHVRLVNRKI